MYTVRVMTIDGILESSTDFADSFAAYYEYTIATNEARRGEGGKGFVYQVIDPWGNVESEVII